MKKTVLILIMGLLHIAAVNLYAAGDLIVEGSVGIGDTANPPLAELAIGRGTPSVLAGVNSQNMLEIRGRDADVNFKGIIAVAEQANTASFGGMTFGINGFANHWGTADLTHALFGLGGQRALVQKRASGGTVTSARAFSGKIAFGSGITGTITNAIDFGAEPINARSGMITNAYSFYSQAHQVGDGTLTNAYGAWFEKQTAGGTTNAGIVLAGDGIGADIVFGPNQEAKIYSSGGELFAEDGAENVTQISPHDPETGEWIFYSKNVKTGRVVRVDMEKLVKAVEKLTGEKFMVETVE